MRVRVEVSGLDEIRNALAQGGKVAADKCKAVLATKVDQIISLARPNVPVEPGGGELAASLRKGRPTYLKASGTVSVAVILGGAPLLSHTRVGRRGIKSGRNPNIYAVLQEYDVARGSPFHHTSGEAHAVERPVEAVAPTIPDDIYAVLLGSDFGGQ
jgi:hypothetical protein